MKLRILISTTGVFLLLSTIFWGWASGAPGYGQSYGHGSHQSNSRRLSGGYAQQPSGGSSSYYNNRHQQQSKGMPMSHQWSRQQPGAHQQHHQAIWGGAPAAASSSAYYQPQPQQQQSPFNVQAPQQTQWAQAPQTGQAYGQQAAQIIQPPPAWAGQQQPIQIQAGSGQPGSPLNVAPSNVVIEQPPPPKVIFMPPEVHYGPPPPELLEAQTKTVLMCKGSPHTVMGDHQYYSCCNDKLYYWKTEVCENGIVKTAPEITTPPTTTSTTTVEPEPTDPPVTSLNCNGSKFFVATAERSNYACCGRTLFDMRTSTCNIDAGTTTVAPSQQASMIRQQQACPLNFLCCDGYTPIPNADERYQCCPGAGPYDTSTQQCVPI